MASDRTAKASLLVSILAGRFRASRAQFGVQLLWLQYSRVRQDTRPDRYAVHAFLSINQHRHCVVGIQFCGSKCGFLRAMSRYYARLAFVANQGSYTSKWSVQRKAEDYNLCGGSKKQCVTYSNFVIDPDTSLIRDFTVDGNGVSSIAIGKRPAERAAYVDAQIVGAYRSSSGLRIAIRIINADQPVRILVDSSVYATAGVAGSARTFVAAPRRLAALQRAYVYVAASKADLGWALRAGHGANGQCREGEGLLVDVGRLKVRRGKSHSPQQMLFLADVTALNRRRCMPCLPSAPC